MPAEESKQTTPANGQNNAADADNELAQRAEVGGIAISFRTMPGDLELLSNGRKYKKPPTEKIRPAILSALPINKPEPASHFAEPPAEKKIPQPAPATELPPAAKPSPLPNADTKAEPFLEKLAHPDDEIEKKLEEIKIKKEKKTEETEKNLQIKTLYKEAKSFKKNNLFSEAAKKLEELLLLSPGHWRAKWMKRRIAQKATSQQKAYEKMREEAKREAKKEAENAKQKIADLLKLQEIKEKELEEKLRKETEIARQKDSELLKIQHEKLAIEQDARQSQEALSMARQEAEKEVRKDFEQLLQKEEKEALMAKQAKTEMEKQLESLRLEKLAVEEQGQKLKDEKSALEELVKHESAQGPLRQGEGEASETPTMDKEESKKQNNLPPAAQEMTVSQPQPASQIYAPPIPLSEAPIQKESLKKKFLAPAISRLRSLLTPKFLKIAVFIFGLIIIGGGSVYLVGLWQIKSENNASPENNSVTATEAVPPAPLFAIDKTEKILLQTGQKKNLFLELSLLSEKDFPPGSFTRILVEVTNQSQEKNYMPLPDLADSLGISLPSGILDAIGPDYTFFLYAQKEVPSGPFLAGLGKNKLGLVFSVKKRETINQQFVAWEKTMPDDLDALFLGKKISFSASYDFQDALYKSVATRVAELPNQFSSLNYGFYNNKTLITTSAESMKALIDRMAPTQ